MEQTTIHYDAFISYRHLPEDMAVAERLQKLLERHKGKDGKKLRVFRDQSELPTSSDLGRDIEVALENSRFLVVICSPSYQDSKWCMKELQYFRQLHGGRNINILPLLISGEPGDVFPRELCWETREITDDLGITRSVQMEIEPLGADVRANSIPQRLRRLRTEYMRIAAPILGVGYDDLYKRAQRRKWATAAVSALTVAAVVLAFTVYGWYMLRQIQAKQMELYESQSLRLANEALPLIGVDPQLAILLADTALPEDLEDPEYAVLPEAELALRSAVLQRAIELNTSPFVVRARIPLTSSHWIIGDLYDGGTKLTVSDNSRTMLYETYTGKLLATVDAAITGATGTTRSVYFINDANQYVISEINYWDGEYPTAAFTLYDTASGAQLGTFETDSINADTFPSYNEVSKRCYIFYKIYNAHENPYGLAGWFDPDGTFTPAQEMTPEAQQMTEEFNAFLDAPLPVNAYDVDRLAEFNIMYLQSVSGCYYLKEATPKELSAVEEFTAQWDREMTFQGVTLSQDGKLAVINLVDTANMAQTYPLESTDHHYTAFWLTEEKKLLALWDDPCVYIPERDLLIRIADTELTLLTLDRSKLSAPVMETEKFEFLSPDGAYAINVQEYAERDYINFGAMQVFATEDLSQPILEENVARAEVSEDGKYLVYSTSVYSSGKSQLLVYSLEERKHVYVQDVAAAPSTLAIDSGSKRIAIVGNGIEVINFLTGKTEQILPLEFKKEYVYLVNLELYGDWLLAHGNGEAYVYDLNTGEMTEVPCNTSNSSTYGDWISNACFTRDGLLILGQDGIMAMGNPTFVAGIYDLNTGKSLSCFNGYSDYGQNYLYDDKSGTLIIQLANEIYAQRRGKNGNFEVVYTISPQHSAMELNMFRAATDGKYLVLNNPSRCEIYDITDGTLLYVLNNPEFATACYGVIDGVLYDLRCGQPGTIGTYPLPDINQAREQAKDYLAYGGICRSLTPQEWEQYYIPAQWQ